MLKKQQIHFGEDVFLLETIALIARQLHCVGAAFITFPPSRLSLGNSHESLEELTSQNNSTARKIERNESHTKKQLRSYCFSPIYQL